jgi:hypothetical protein
MNVSLGGVGSLGAFIVGTAPVNFWQQSNGPANGPANGCHINTSIGTGRAGSDEQGSRVEFLAQVGGQQGSSVGQPVARRVGQASFTAIRNPAQNQHQGFDFVG